MMEIHITIYVIYYYILFSNLYRAVAIIFVTGKYFYDAAARFPFLFRYRCYCHIFGFILSIARDYIEIYDVFYRLKVKEKDVVYLSQKHNLDVFKIFNDFKKNK